MDITQVLQFMQEAGASDLHLSSGAPPLMRLHGDMQPIRMPGLPEGNLDQKGCHELIYGILTGPHCETLEKEKELDFALALPGIGRFRANVFFQGRGLAGVFRTIPTKIPSFDDLGLPEVLRDFTRLPRGMVVVTGPTGSGKSTTLAAMLDLVNETRPDHIITIEDPIEFVHRPKQCLVNQREVGPHTHSFSNALRAALREDPDIILVGEMRDLETISLAITAAETGHVVFGTLHTSSAHKTVDRIINVFPANEQETIRAMLAESIKGVVAQNLLKKKGGGRVACHEILVCTAAVQNMIREGKTHQIPSAIQTGRNQGMISMAESIRNLYKSGLIAREVAMDLAPKVVEEEDQRGGLSQAQTQLATRRTRRAPVGSR